MTANAENLFTDSSHLWPGGTSLIAWNSQMALDARHHIFYQDSQPQRIWKVESSEGKEFVLKLYEVTDGTGAVDEGLYFESKHLDDEVSYEMDGPESGTEWAYVETSVESFLNHYKNTEKLNPSDS